KLSLSRTPQNGGITELELGLKNTPLLRTKDGYFVSSNFPRDPKLIKEETSGFDPGDASSSMNARHHRAGDYGQNLKGQIDVELAEQFLSDHVDRYERTTLDKKVDQPNERALCGHVDNSPRGV